jgi:glyoxylase-like metal-dependent hydrolase (beta-lactamase superfamily II)
VPHASIRVGSVEVVPLCDGFAPLSLDAEAPGRIVDWAAQRSAYPWAFAGDGEWAWHVHAFLVRSGEGLTLVDTGIGHLGRVPYEVTGRIEEELASVGASPDEVRHVVHTHLHADHAGGACRPDGSPRFPNAVHHVHPADWAFFAGTDDADDFQGRTAMAALERAGMLDLDPDDREVSSGVRVVHTPGHTPGHRSAVLTDGASSLLLTGDLLHLPFQIAHPDWASSHDVDPQAGSASRVQWVDAARAGGWVVAVSHFAEPFGSVTDHDGAPSWES